MINADRVKEATEAFNSVAAEYGSEISLTAMSISLCAISYIKAGHDIDDAEVISATAVFKAFKALSEAHKQGALTVPADRQN